MEKATASRIQGRRWLRWLFWLATALALSVLACQLLVIQSARGRLYNTVSSLPARQVGLLLGTSKYVTGGQPNLYYQFRLDAAEAAFKAGKVQTLLVSGDNSTTSYDEPSTIKADLIGRGIPAGRIVLDYAGFRTLDSIVRAKKVFGQQQFTVISQPFHNQRAIFLARARGLDAIGLNARDVTGPAGQSVQNREILARVNAVLDVLLNKQPKFLGDPIKLP